jgi:catechol 2,3-dioxygenase-like lactoylglutathione lyase family enzyme
MRIHHVQISMPSGQEDEARRFYADALGLTEVQKPPSLAGHGGCWFRGFDEDSATVCEIHLGVDDPFVAVKKAHPGPLVDSVAELEKLADRVEAGGFELSWTERDTFEGMIRFHCRDGFGNRIEVMTPAVA